MDDVEAVPSVLDRIHRFGERQRRAVDTRHRERAAAEDQHRPFGALERVEHRLRQLRDQRGIVAEPFDLVGQRSEEHTSELQSLMRISYAVFCLKKKKILNSNILR